MNKPATLVCTLTFFLLSLVLSTGCDTETSPNDPASLYTKHATFNYDLASKDTNSQLLAMADEQLKKGNYQQVVTHLENYLAEHPNAPYASLALAVAQVHMDQDRRAKTYLKTLEGTGTEYEDAAFWETAMIYLKQEFPQASIFNLQQISPEFPRYKEAQDLITTLKWMLDEKEK